MPKPEGNVVYPEMLVERYGLGSVTTHWPQFVRRRNLHSRRPCRSINYELQMIWEPPQSNGFHDNKYFDVGQIPASQKRVTDLTMLLLK